MLDTYNRKGYLKHDQDNKANILFGNLYCKNSFHVFKKALCCHRGISTEWMFAKHRHKRTYSSKWKRRMAYFDNAERMGL